MDYLLTKANQFFSQLPDIMRRHRIWVWLTFIVMNVVIFMGASRFNIDMTLEAYFRADDPAKQAYDRFRAEFGGDEGMLLVYEARDGDIFSNESLLAVKRVQDVLLNYRLEIGPDEPSQLDHITDVRSLVNAAYMEAVPGGLISRPFIGDDLPASAEQIGVWKQQAFSHPDFPKQYFSPDLKYGAIFIRTDFNAKIVQYPQKDTASDSMNGEEGGGGSSHIDDGQRDSDVYMDEFDHFDDDIEMSFTGDANNSTAVDDVPPTFERTNIDDYARFMDVINPILDDPKVKAHVVFYPVGNPPVMTFFSNVILQEMALVAGLSLLIIAVSLWILFRSLSAVFWSLSIVVVTFLWVVGLIGWTGVVMTFMINIIVFLILAVGVADAVHIMSGYLYFRGQNESHEQALRSVFNKSGLACLLTSVTTAIGLCALILVPVVPIRNFGIFAALGVLIAFVLTVTILPLLLDIWAPSIKRRNQLGLSGKNEKESRPQGNGNSSAENSQEVNHLLQRYLRKIEHLGYTYPKAVITGFVLFTIVMTGGIFQVRVDSNIVEIIPQDSWLHKSYNVVDQSLFGAQNMDMIFETQTKDAFKDPLVLNTMSQLHEYIEATYPDIVGRTMSIVNVTKHAHQVLQEGKAEAYAIPQDPDVAAQTLFLFNNANGKDRRQLVSDDFSRARLTITFRNAGSYVYSPIIDDIQSYADQLFVDVRQRYPDLSVQLTGGMSLMMKLMDYVSWSQIQSFGLALIVISLLLFVVFGSKLVGVLAILPNILPIITAFGIMGYFGMSLDTDTLLVAPIVIGIAVDDTIHFLTHYREGIMRRGNIIAAIHQTVREAGQAITFTSIVLALGFSVFVLSSHMSLRHFGVLSAVAIMVALITDLLLLPALCKAFKADFGLSRKKMEQTTNMAA